MRHFVSGVLAAAALAASFATTHAQMSAGDPDAGLRVAERWCVGCHVVDPKASAASNDAVPTFTAIARRPATDSATLHAFLRAPHPPMPDLSLGRVDVDDLAAYILSLRQR